MEMKGEQRIAAPRAKVWEALNDAEVLRKCIPGCQSLDKEGDRMKAVVEIKIGPIGARFNGAVTISDANPPESYTISGEGQGGTVGNAKGGAKVRLTEVDGGTLLSYEVDAQVGGRLAQLGGPIIDATAKQLAGKFFTKFGDVVEGPPAGAAPEAAPATVAGAALAAAASGVAVAAPQYVSAAPASGGTLWGWIVAVALAVVTGFLIGRSTEGEIWMIGAILTAVVAAAAGFEAGKRNGAGR
ncbi:carbon monoxide dehydrogenase subunit G [Novosphingobium sp. G106]|uniref:CoxG family protein n=1 Tax=Novosphingobium sp. G106 TaxID=2849500 RepID=UPI001C2DC30E|nr:carbon monoxide dehydrogenase subunit G [Novosphingobium sp. G106]MBV1691235.1 carbon monoxide dehydrogenase subunit G [Novosphingobium sp. G106]